LFSFSQTKQDLYIFSIVAAVAALGGDWIARAAFGEASAPRALDLPARADSRWLTATLSVLALVLAAFGAFVLYLFAALAVYRIEGALIAGTLLLGGGVALAVLAWRRRYAAAVACVLAVFVAFNWVLMARILPSFEAYKPVVPLADVISREAGADDIVAHFDVALPSMVFYLQRHIDIWFDPGAFGNQMRLPRKVLAVLPAHRYESLKGELRVPTCVLARHPTSEIRLRDLLRFESPPEVVLITNRCGSASTGGTATVK
jgi:hypothetical protein